MKGGSRNSRVSKPAGSGDWPAFGGVMKKPPDKNPASLAKLRYGKKYSFNAKHNKDVPLETWFQYSSEGLILFVVFYTQACRWSQCLGCNLPSTSSREHIDFEALMRQIDQVFRDSKVLSKRRLIRKVIVSNNGSVLDEATFSSTALIYLIAKMNLLLPNLEIVSLETRAEYVDMEELEFLSRVLKEGKTPTILELAVGVEAFDDQVRQKIFRKGLPLEVLEQLAKKIAPFGYHLKCYFMQKPVPKMSDAEAVDDVRKGIDYLSEISLKYRLSINMHLNPTFVARGTSLEEEFLNGRYTPPSLRDVLKAVLHAEGKPLSVYVGLYDEHLAVKGGSFIRKGDAPLIKRLEHFNRTQNYRCLRKSLT